MTSKLKKIKFWPYILFVSISWSQHKVNVNHLLEYGGLKYMPFSEKPYSGKVFELYNNGEKHWEKVYKNGLENGYYKSWYPSGKQQMKVMLRKGNWDGKYIYWFENGKSKEEIKYKNGIKDGKYTFWSEEGQKIEQGLYSNGKKHGLNISYYDNGKKEQEISYSNGELHGPRKSWYEGGKMKEEANYNLGKLNGEYQSWSLNGKLLKQRNYLNDTLHGPSTMWWRNVESSGTVKKNIEKLNGPFGSPNQNHFKKEETFYVMGELDGIYKNWQSDGILIKEILYAKGKINGPSIIWWPNGNKKDEIVYSNGKPNGSVSSWFENGQKKEQYFISKEKKYGVHSTWFKNGQKKYEHTYSSGKLNGASSIWYQGGQKKESGFYFEGKPNGYFTYWNENGQRREEGSFKNGKREGLYTYWHDNGQKRQEINYTNGNREGKTIVWWPNGQKKKSGKNKDGKPIGKWNYWSNDGAPQNESFTLKTNKKDPLKKGNKILSERKFNDGPYVAFHPNGMIKEKGNYKNGEKDGSWRLYNSRGQVLQLETYSSGKISELKKPGAMRKYATFHENGRVKSEGILNNGERDGEWKVYNEKGDLEKTAYFDFGELVVERGADITSDYIDYHENGRIKEQGKTFHGQRDGKWKFFNEAGQLTKTIHYLMGEMVTVENPTDIQEFVSYHDNGRIKERGMTNKNERDGEWMMYNNKGNLSKIIMYQNGKIIIEKDATKFEEFVSYHDNGRIKEQGQTYMGKKDGKWKFYNDKGKLTRTIFYLVGDIIKQDSSM